MFRFFIILIKRKAWNKPRRNLRNSDVWVSMKVESRQNRSGWQLSADRCYVVLLCSIAWLMPYMDIFPPYGNPQTILSRGPNGKRFPTVLISHPETEKKLSNHAVIGSSLCEGDLWQLKLFGPNYRNRESCRHRSREFQIFNI